MRFFRQLNEFAECRQEFRVLRFRANRDAQVCGCAENISGARNHALMQKRVENLFAVFARVEPDEISEGRRITQAHFRERPVELTLTFSVESEGLRGMIGVFEGGNRHLLRHKIDVKRLTSAV